MCITFINRGRNRFYFRTNFAVPARQSFSKLFNQYTRGPNTLVRNQAAQQEVSGRQASSFIYFSPSLPVALLNSVPLPPSSMEKLSSTKPVPCTKRLGTDAVNYEIQYFSLSLVGKKPFPFLCNFGALFPEILLYDSFSFMLFPLFCIIFSIWLKNQGCFTGGSAVKNPPAMKEMQVWSLGWQDPLEKEMTTHSSILAWEIPWTEVPGRLQSMGLHTKQLKESNESFPFISQEFILSYVFSLSVLHFLSLLYSHLSPVWYPFHVNHSFLFSSDPWCI